MAQPGHCLVTGGAGFIGSHLTERLLADGHAVTVLDNFSTGSRQNLQAVAGHPRLKIVDSRTLEATGLDAVIASHTMVFHLAAAVGVDLVLAHTTASLETNLLHSHAVLTAAARHRIPIIAASSSEVYGKSPRELFSEEDDLLFGPPTVTRWSYGCSKLLLEHLAFALSREQGLQVTLARIFNTVGPRQSGCHGMVLPRFVDAALNNEPLLVHGDGRQTRCFCWVGDTVEALVRLGAVTSSTQGARVVNVGNDVPVQIGELARQIVECFKSSSAIRFIPHLEGRRPGFEDLSHRRPDLTRLHALTGFKPATTLPEILAQLRSLRAG